MKYLLIVVSFALTFNGFSQGTVKEKLNSKGIVIEKGNYDHGKKVGTWEYFYDDGVVSLKSNYTKGILEGESVRYDLKGNVIAMLNYKNGKLTGEQTYFYTTDKPLSKGNMINGKEEGNWQYFSPSGELIGNVKYKNGVQSNELTKSK